MGCPSGSSRFPLIIMVYLFDRTRALHIGSKKGSEGLTEGLTFLLPSVSSNWGAHSFAVCQSRKPLHLWTALDL